MDSMMEAAANLLFILMQLQSKILHGIGVYLASSFGHKIHKRNPEMAFFNNPDL